MNVICQFAKEECVEGCNGDWLQCVLEVLRNNKVHLLVFAEATWDLLANGRGKFII